LTNNKEFNSLLKNQLELIKNKRKGLFNRTNLPEQIKAKKILELANEEKHLKSKEYKEHYEKISEIPLVDFNKTFLKYKKEIRPAKKKILSDILKIGTQLRDIMGLSDFKKLIEKLYKTKYEVSNNKIITFKTLLHHLESGQVSENVEKTVKKIEELRSIKNITNRKTQMEIGIKKKEIDYLLKEYDKTLESLKKIAASKFPNKEITNNDINSLLKKEYNKDNSKEYQEKVNALGLKFQKLSIEIKTKIKKLEKLEKLS